MIAYNWLRFFINCVHNSYFKSSEIQRRHRNPVFTQDCHCHRKNTEYKPAFCEEYRFTLHNFHTIFFLLFRLLSRNLSFVKNTDLLPHTFHHNFFLFLLLLRLLTKKGPFIKNNESPSITVSRADSPSVCNS